MSKRVIVKFIRKAKEHGFEEVTWYKHKDGNKSHTVLPCYPTQEQIDAVHRDQYKEILVPNITTAEA